MSHLLIPLYTFTPTDQTTVNRCLLCWLLKIFTGSVDRRERTVVRMYVVQLHPFIAAGLVPPSSVKWEWNTALELWSRGPERTSRHVSANCFLFPSLILSYSLWNENFLIFCLSPFFFSPSPPPPFLLLSSSCYQRKHCWDHNKYRTLSTPLRDQAFVLLFTGPPFRVPGLRLLVGNW